VQCGFNDENYFCRYFRLKAGSSPSLFVAKHEAVSRPEARFEIAAMRAYGLTAGFGD
jgi:AraC-like DNA-binding protein